MPSDATIGIEEDLSGQVSLATVSWRSWPP
jgi:hypothetical protein